MTAGAAIAYFGVLALIWLGLPGLVWVSKRTPRYLRYAPSLLIWFFRVVLVAFAVYGIVAMARG